MKLLYKLLLGALIFNSMLVLFSAFFISSPISEGAINVSSDPTYAEYKLSENSIVSMSGLSVSVMGISFALGAIASWLMKSPIPIGVGLFGSIIALFAGPAAIIYQLDPTHNYIVAGLIGTIGVGIGILAAIAVIGMFTQQGEN